MTLDIDVHWHHVGNVSKEVLMGNQTGFQLAKKLIEDNASAETPDSERTLREVYELLLEVKAQPTVVPPALRFREEQIRREEREACAELCFEYFRSERAQIGMTRGQTPHDYRMQGAAECARRILGDDDARTVPVRRAS
jgi:hypothetical protein